MAGMSCCLRACKAQIQNHGGVGNDDHLGNSLFIVALAWDQSPQLNIFHKFSPDFLDFPEVGEVTEELICRRAGVRRRRGN